MERAPAHPLPARDPISGGPLIVTEVEGEETGITIRGRFHMPRFAQLSAEQERFLETFLRCRGMLNSVEKELGISYPTARGRLDALLKALDLTPRAEDPPAPPSPPEPPIPLSFETPPAPPTPPGVPIPPGEVGAPPVSPPDEKAEPLEEPPPSPPRRSPKEILDAIERGEMTPEEAKREAAK